MGDHSVAIDIAEIAVEEHDHIAPRACVDRERDALLGKEAADEVEIGLAVLRCVDAFRVAARELKALAVLWDAGAGEDLLHDVRCRHVLEDAAIRPLREAEEAWPRGHAGPGLLVAARG